MSKVTQEVVKLLNFGAEISVKPLNNRAFTTDGTANDFAMDANGKFTKYVGTENNNAIYQDFEDADCHRTENNTKDPTPCTNP